MVTFLKDLTQGFVNRPFKKSARKAPAASGSIIAEATLFSATETPPQDAPDAKDALNPRPKIVIKVNDIPIESVSLPGYQGENSITREYQLLLDIQSVKAGERFTAQWHKQWQEEPEIQPDGTLLLMTRQSRIPSRAMESDVNELLKKLASMEPNGAILREEDKTRLLQAIKNDMAAYKSRGNRR